jgi:hypothetical protein
MSTAEQTPTVDAIRGDIRASFGDDDPWGTAMGWAFALGEALAVTRYDYDQQFAYAVNDAFDAHEFGPAPSGVLRELDDLIDGEGWERHVVASAVLDGDATPWHVLYLFRVMCRYADLLDAAGLSY